jgi:hypothetical protein
MRLIAVSLLLSIGFVSRGMAEERVNVLPEIVIGSKPRAATATNVGGGTGAGAPTGAPVGSDRCVEVEIGSSRAMDCLNQKLKREVDRVNPSVNLPPIDARSPDIKTGVVNIPGVKQQYGKNFGVSAVPYRPAPSTFTSPITSHR